MNVLRRLSLFPRPDSGRLISARKQAWLGMGHAILPSITPSALAAIRIEDYVAHDDDIGSGELRWQLRRLPNNHEVVGK